MAAGLGSVDGVVIEIEVFADAAYEHAILAHQTPDSAVRSAARVALGLRLSLIDHRRIAA
jgi:hypothetical protein